MCTACEKVAELSNEPLAEVLLNCRTRLVSFRVLEVLPEPYSCLKRTARAGIQPELRQIRCHYLARADNALCKQCLIDQSRTVRSRKRDRGNNDIDVVRLSPRLKHVDDICYLVIYWPCKDPGPGTKYGFAVPENIPRKPEPWLKIVFIQGDGIGFVLKVISQAIVQRNIRADLPRILAEEGVTSARTFEQRVPKTLLINLRGVDVVCLEGVDRVARIAKRVA